MSELTYKRSVRYYHFHLVRKNSGGRLIESSVFPPEDWRDRIKETFAQAENGLLIPGDKAGIRYYLHEHDSRPDLIQVSMHSRMNLSFSTEISEDASAPKDFRLLDSQGSRYLAKATSVTLGVMNDRLVAAIAQGTRDSAPGIRALERLIGYGIPLKDKSWSWKHKGVMLESDRKIMENSNGVVAFSGGFISELLPTHDDVITRTMAELRSYLGTDVQLTLTCQVADRYSKTGTDKLRDLVARMPFYAKTKKPKATIIDENGVEKVLTLVRHDFASEIYLRPDDLIGANFSSLLKLTTENFIQESPNVAPIVERFMPIGKGKGTWGEGKTQLSGAGESPTLF